MQLLSSQLALLQVNPKVKRKGLKEDLWCCCVNSDTLRAGRTSDNKHRKITFF